MSANAASFAGKNQNLSTCVQTILYTLPLLAYTCTSMKSVISIESFVEHCIASATVQWQCGGCDCAVSSLLSPWDQRGTLQS